MGLVSTTLLAYEKKAFDGVAVKHMGPLITDRPTKLKVTPEAIERTARYAGNLPHVPWEPMQGIVGKVQTIFDYAPIMSSKWNALNTIPNKDLLQAASKHSQFPLVPSCTSQQAIT